MHLLLACLPSDAQHPHSLLNHSRVLLIHDATVTVHFHAGTKFLTEGLLGYMRHVDIICRYCPRASITRKVTKIVRYTEAHTHTTPSSHYMALRAVILPLPRVHGFESVVARTLASVPSNTLLGEASPSISFDEGCLHWLDRVHLARILCGHHLALCSYENRLHPVFDSTYRWCGRSADELSYFSGVRAADWRKSYLG